MSRNERRRRPADRCAHHPQIENHPERLGKTAQNYQKSKMGPRRVTIECWATTALYAVVHAMWGDLCHSCPAALRSAHRADAVLELREVPALRAELLAHLGGGLQ